MKNKQLSQFSIYISYTYLFIPFFVIFCGILPSSRVYKTTIIVIFTVLQIQLEKLAHRYKVRNCKCLTLV